MGFEPMSRMLYTMHHKHEFHTTTAECTTVCLIIYQH